MCGVAGTSDPEVLVEPVERVDDVAGERGVAAVEVRHLPPPDSARLDALGGLAGAQLLVDRAGDGVGVGQPRLDGRPPAVGDGQPLVDERDGVSRRSLDAGVAGGVDRPVGHLDEDVDVVAVADHTGRPVGGGAVDHDHLGVGRALRQSVETGGESVTRV
jgi:hypothetical protein